MRNLVVCVVGVGTCLGWPMASAADPDKPVVAAVIDGADLESSTLIGTSGQIFEPQSGSWKRSGLGGIACRVRAAYKVGSEFWAMCRSAPLFRRSGTTWSAEPFHNRGRTRPGQVRTPLISVGRHIYGVRRSGWERIVSAPSSILSLLAVSEKSAHAVTARREVIKLTGARWKTLVAAPKRRRLTDDPPASLFGSAGQVYVVLESGKLRRLVGRKLRKLRLPGGATEFRPVSSCAISGGATLVLGTATRGSVEEQALWRFAGAAVTPFAELPSPGDEATLLHCLGDTLLIASRGGQVFVKKGEQAWVKKAIDPKPIAAEINKATPGARPATTP